MSQKLMKTLAIYYRDPKTRSFTRIKNVKLRYINEKEISIESNSFDAPEWVRRQIRNASQMTIYLPSYWRGK